jgi:CitMHS family citrate-Mg2+:H+ or citrate-Ca2+:H+ symporter
MWLGYAMIVTFMVAIMTRRLSALVALIIIPIVFGAIAGHGLDMAAMAVDGITKLAPTATLLLFAVLFFSVMMDGGLFEPLVRRILRFAGDDPKKVVVGTALMALVVSLDGDGATTVLIVVTAFLPLHRRLGLNPLILAVVLASANTVINLAPWGGPTGRAAAALQLDVGTVFFPLLPTMAAGVAATLGIAWYLGRSEARRLANNPHIPAQATAAAQAASPPPPPSRLVFAANLALTLIVILCALFHLMPLPIVFMAGLAIALMINVPDPKAQRDRLAAHAANALPIVILILAAGVFTGVLQGTGMITAMARGVAAILPGHLGPAFGPVVAVLAAPLTFALSNEAYYFGVLPILAQTAAEQGVSPYVVARASLLAQPIHALSPLVAALYLVSGLLDVDVGALQRFSLKWAALLTLVLIVTAAASGAIV